VRIDLFDFELPPERIATRPPAARDGGRLLVLGGDVDSPALLDKQIADLPDLLPPGALVVLNDTRVLPARLFGQKVSGGKVELLLVRRVGEAVVGEGDDARPAEQWRAMGKASKPFKFPLDVAIGEGGRLFARLLGRAEDGLLDVLLHVPSGARVLDALEALGHMPLPPYMHREDELSDRERYQTVFARTPGAVAAPTAGLHLTDVLLGRLALREIQVAMLTLHVGLGTFQPVTAEDLDTHPMHSEEVTISQSAVDAVAAARERGAPVVAIGTTVTRALESAADPDRPGHLRTFRGPTNLLIQPGYSFRVVDSLFTNFHLPKSTLLALVSAFGGRSRVLAAYRHAILAGYRFYSYGDAMLLPARVPADRAAS
jgi:S-adenosylmethionine:tRNA ribosyltransferase-isomerase